MAEGGRSLMAQIRQSVAGDALTEANYRDARRLVAQQIALLYRQWGAQAAGVGAEDLMQIGLLSLIKAGTIGPLGRVTVRHDFSDLLRSLSGIRRNPTALRTGLSKTNQARYGYTPLEPMRGYEALTEVEQVVDCERTLERLYRARPKEMQFVESVAQGEGSAQIAQRFGVGRDTVWMHCHLFRRALCGDP